MTSSTTLSSCAGPRSVSSRARGRGEHKRQVPLVAGDLLELVERSRTTLLLACHAATAAERYEHAHMAALRACAALLAVRAPRAVGSRPRNAWQTLAAQVPECAEWAEFFQLTARRSRAVSVGISRVEQREADDLIRQSELFLDVVLGKLGLPAMPTVGQEIAPTAVTGQHRPGAATVDSGGDAR